MQLDYGPLKSPKCTIKPNNNKEENQCLYKKKELMKPSKSKGAMV